jgi:hypothetical protein
VPARPAIPDRSRWFDGYAAELRLHHRVEDLLEHPGSTLDARDALAHAGELREVLAAHRDVEDADVLPLFVLHFDADEFAAFDAKAVERVSLRQRCFTVPWLAATVEPAVASGDVLDLVELPIAGLISDRTVEEVATQVLGLEQPGAGWGSALEAPAMIFSLVSLGVIPGLRLTKNRRLVDGVAFALVPVVVEP